MMCAPQYNLSLIQITDVNIFAKFYRESSQTDWLYRSVVFLHSLHYALQYISMRWSTYWSWCAFQWEIKYWRMWFIYTPIYMYVSRDSYYWTVSYLPAWKYGEFHAGLCKSAYTGEPSPLKWNNKPGYTIIGLFVLATQWYSECRKNYSNIKQIYILRTCNRKWAQQ